MWYGGTLTMVASSSPALPNSSELTRYEARFRWRSTAAFGSPVVPLVNSRTAVASGSQPQPSVSSIDSSSTVARKSARVDELDPVDARQALGHARRRRSPWPAPPARRSSAAGRRPAGSSPARTACRRWPTPNSAIGHGRASSRRSSTTRSPGWAASQVPARRARWPSSAKVSPPSSGTDGHPVAEAVGGHLEDHPDVHGRSPQSEDGRGLAPFTSERGVAERERPGAGLRAEQLDGLVLGDVALADEGALVERGRRRAAGGGVVDGHHRLAAAAEVDLAGALHHHDLGRARHRPQTGSGLGHHRHLVPPVGPPGPSQ